LRYSEVYMEHFQAPRNVGEVETPDGRAEVEHEGGGCFDRLRVTLSVEEGIVREARFKARACSGTIAASSAATDWAAGRTLDEVERVTPEALEEILGEVPEAKRHSLELAAEGLRKAAGEARRG
jgi:NifU-like protein